MSATEQVREELYYGLNGAAESVANAKDADLQLAMSVVYDDSDDKGGFLADPEVEVYAASRMGGRSPPARPPIYSPPPGGRTPPPGARTPPPGSARTPPPAASGAAGHTSGGAAAPPEGRLRMLVTSDRGLCPFVPTRRVLEYEARLEAVWASLEAPSKGSARVPCVTTAPMDLPPPGIAGRQGLVTSGGEIVPPSPAILRIAAATGARLPEAGAGPGPSGLRVVASAYYEVPVPTDEAVARLRAIPAPGMALLPEDAGDGNLHYNLALGKPSIIRGGLAALGSGATAPVAYQLPAPAWMGHELGRISRGLPPSPNVGALAGGPAAARGQLAHLRSLAEQLGLPLGSLPDPGVPVPAHATVAAAPVRKTAVQVLEGAQGRAQMAANAALTRGRWAGQEGAGREDETHADQYAAREENGAIAVVPATDMMNPAARDRNSRLTKAWLAAESWVAGEARGAGGVAVPIYYRTPKDRQVLLSEPWVTFRQEGDPAPPGARRRGAAVSTAEDGAVLVYVAEKLGLQARKEQSWAKVVGANEWLAALVAKTYAGALPLLFREELETEASKYGENAEAEAGVAAWQLAKAEGALALFGGGAANYEHDRAKRAAHEAREAYARARRALAEQPRELLDAHRLAGYLADIAPKSPGPMKRVGNLRAGLNLEEAIQVERAFPPALDKEYMGRPSVEAALKGALENFGAKCQRLERGMRGDINKAAREQPGRAVLLWGGTPFRPPGSLFYDLPEKAHFVSLAGFTGRASGFWAQEPKAGIGIETIQAYAVVEGKLAKVTAGRTARHIHFESDPGTMARRDALAAAVATIKAGPLPAWAELGPVLGAAEALLSDLRDAAGGPYLGAVPAREGETEILLAQCGHGRRWEGKESRALKVLAQYRDYNIRLYCLQDRGTSTPLLTEGGLAHPKSVVPGAVGGESVPDDEVEEYVEVMGVACYRWAAWLMSNYEVKVGTEQGAAATKEKWEGGGATSPASPRSKKRDPPRKLNGGGAGASGARQPRAGYYRSGFYLRLPCGDTVDVLDFQSTCPYCRGPPSFDARGQLAAAIRRDYARRNEDGGTCLYWGSDGIDIPPRGLGPDELGPHVATAAKTVQDHYMGLAGSQSLLHLLYYHPYSGWESYWAPRPTDDIPAPPGGAAGGGLEAFAQVQSWAWNFGRRESVGGPLWDDMKNWANERQ
jgi:hypothetical protein